MHPVFSGTSASHGRTSGGGLRREARFPRKLTETSPTTAESKSESNGGSAEESWRRGGANPLGLGLPTQHSRDPSTRLALSQAILSKCSARTGYAASSATGPGPRTLAFASSLPTGHFASPSEISFAILLLAQHFRPASKDRGCSFSQDRQALLPLLPNQVCIETGLDEQASALATASSSNPGVISRWNCRP